MRQMIPGDLVRNRFVSSDLDLYDAEINTKLSCLKADEVGVVIGFDPKFPACIELLSVDGRGWTYDANVELVRSSK